MPLDRIAARTARGEDAGPFSPLTPIEPVPVGGEIVYAFGPEWIDIEPSRLATESTLVEVQGRTKYGEESDLPFHVSSADWQESDRVFAGILSAFGSKTRAIPIGGYGTFDGVMTEIVQGSAHRRRVQRRADAGVGCRVGRGARQGHHPEQLCGRHRRQHHLGLVGDQDGWALLARIPAAGRRRRDQREDRDRGPAGRRSAARVCDRRLRHRRPPERRVHRHRQIPHAEWLRPDGDRRRRVLR